MIEPNEQLTEEEHAAGFVIVCDWIVAPTYIAPVGIAEAEALAKEAGYELPTPELVSLIWEHADLRLEPHPLHHDGTPKTMASEAAYRAHAAVVMGQIAGRAFRLLAGSHKDVCRIGEKIGLYGWHRKDGRVIQPVYTGHAGAWKDYSQGLRLCRRLR